jgi:all-trans-retinol dehydrogenase (NAD+)
MTKIAGKIVLITGGASGIGHLMGQLALENGAKELIICDIDAQRTDEAVSAFSLKGHKVRGLITDISSAVSVKRTAAICKQENLLPDILILNAGIVSGKYFHEHEGDEIEKTIGVNVLGCMLITSEFLKEMIQRGSGHIVTIASAAGMLANPRMAVYAASKWAVLGWSESLRLEMKRLKTGIHVTTVTPSYISTGMFEGARVNPLLPVLKPKTAVKKILHGIEKNKRFVRMPALVYTLPLLKGLLPASWFDSLVGYGLGVYRSMDHFSGHQGK